MAGNVKNLKLLFSKRYYIILFKIITDFGRIIHVCIESEHLELLRQIIQQKNIIGMNLKFQTKLRSHKIHSENVVEMQMRVQQMLDNQIIVEYKIQQQLSFVGEKTRRINNNAFAGFVIQYVSVNTQRVKFECFNLHLSKRISHLMRFRYSDANIRFSFQLA